ncbi:MAG: hypothetical protein JW888_10590, partial [Pirellulales bacterium]|nr:hypothetical protein [Pirellulales bacterium]
SPGAEPALGDMPRQLSTLDWGVIGIYMLSLVAIGWYYSRRTATTRDYLLGGRTMKPWTVGLSLFASLMSVLTYLAVPGEMVKHGPMYIAYIAVFPFVVLIVGWWLIPAIMRLEITSAYEILEGRLGLVGRLLGAGLFLVIRLLWMATIIYATTNEVFIPLLGWPPETGPYLSAVLCLLTVAYTSMGGLRAVVLTDVVQTFILLGGALVTVFLISAELGDATAWWPSHWAANWDEPTWFDPNARMSFLSAALAMLVWNVCTAGSDQMAIQRYLATRDVKSARRMYAMSVGANALVTLVLAFVGFALLAYFQAKPEMLGAGKSVTTEADQLFPWFILIGLPGGVRGLVVAGLLAATMSSLSSGVSSACSVVTVDGVERFSARASSEKSRLRTAKALSCIIGVVVYGLTFLIGCVEGNLLELAFKVVNLLVAPLFVLFFLALFVRWATPFGAVCATVAGVAVAVGIAFCPDYLPVRLGFVWIMPGSLVTGIVAGLLTSLLPVGKKGPPVPPPASQED